jgi:integrase
LQQTPSTRRAFSAGPNKITWPDFKARYLGEHVASLAPKSVNNVQWAFNCIDRHLNPDKLCKVNAAALSTLQAKLRATGIKETSIASVLRTVRAAMGWAESVGLLNDVPKIVMPKRARGKGMKGGPLLGEQFDRLLMAVPKIRPKDSEEWARFLEGVLLSGLRLGEAVELSWDSSASFSLDLTGRHPRFRIKGEAQKSGKDQLLPMVPEAGEFFLVFSPERRHGRVFRLNSARTGKPLPAEYVGKVVVAIGEAARVLVDPTDGKYASCHDLRRTFGSKWARRVMPAVLQRLMRHESINTTMRYYIDLDVDALTDELWSTHPAAGKTVATGNNSGNNEPPRENAAGGFVATTADEI